ncbi:uncharacterized protein LOC115471313 [Microcaecilia unicolor]|uniref:ATP-dependent DNA helicase n=1 Tax=Microcaecilia unicolor TaxID=1415580 RepID=A0A6P7YCV6_9AMPH|nr:uncharacterized protein LOC115471313 [Microcaecilia unicolor]
MGANISLPPGYGPYCFRINGTIYHRTASLHPDENKQRQFAQLYILDPDEAAVQRLQILPNAHIHETLMTQLSNFMASENPFADACKMLYEVENESIAEAQRLTIEPPIISMAIVQDRKHDPRRYNAPRPNEVAFIFQNSEGKPPLQRDLIIHCRNTENNKNKTEIISVLDPNLEPMVYPLLFPHGDQSWGINIPLSEQPECLRNMCKKLTNKRNRVTQMQYYGYRFAIRDDFNPFLSAGKLTQQYFVDAYIKTEANRLNYIRQNQKLLRVEKYKGLMDHLASESTAPQFTPGQPFILPSTFSGSPRNMHQNYKDAMAIVRKYGKPDLFITMTCNPRWEEITENLQKGQTPEFRPDLLARVFHLKLKQLLHDICKEHILGIPLAKIHVIEFQKRGLPHAHILLILKEEHKPKNTELIDKIVCAEIPDKEKFPRLHAIVAKHMIHGPCNDTTSHLPCMVSGKCSKKFPKPFQNETIQNCDGYPKYHRRDNGVGTLLHGKIINNTWVVPYNPFLLLKYNSHINVEVCASIKSVKYLFKYVYKGHDCANVVITEHKTQQHDEIKTFTDSRYVTAPEAAWRLNAFEMHQQSHTIQRLEVHLPDEQSIVFHPKNIDIAVETAKTRDTTLTAWFKLNAEHPHANNILYNDIPMYYTFNKTQRKWKQRKTENNKTIGRMYAVHLAADPERYSLRLILLHKPGAKCFQDLKTVQHTVYNTFQDAAKKMGLIHDEAVWENTLDDAVTCSMPQQIRELFAYICVFAAPCNALQIYQKYNTFMLEDFTHMHGCTQECTVCEQLCLLKIQTILHTHGKNLEQFGLPPTIHKVEDPSLAFKAADEKHMAQIMQQNLNHEQREVLNTILSACKEKEQQKHCFFLDGPAGTGKTYTYKTILSTIRGDGDIALPVASTGIAANLFPGGRTYHSQFKLPVPLLENSTSTIRLNSNNATILRDARILIWDESTMAPTMALTAVDTLLKDIMKNDKPFGGKVLLLAGDFRQTLPVVPHGDQTQIIEASIKFNKLWKQFHILKLQHNVRCTDPEYNKWLLDLANGKLPCLHGFQDVIETPEKHICYTDIVTAVFGDKITADTVANFAQKTILCPKNTDADKINDNVLNILEGNTIIYLSTDSINDSTEEEKHLYPVEFLHQQTPTGMPPHNLHLKIGAIIILLRNLNTKKGLCNGTRLIVKDLKKNLLITQVLTGSSAGSTVFIPRIDLAPSNTDLPFILSRRQFPVKLAFAMTINKSQG